MSFSVGSVEIKRPKSIKEVRVEQYAQQKALDGTVSRDYFSFRVGTKRVWELTYDNVQPSDYNVIDGVYTTYKSTDTAQPWVSDYVNYDVEATVHMDLVNREFTQQGTDFISSFTLILTEQ